MQRRFLKVILIYKYCIKLKSNVFRKVCLDELRIFQTTIEKKVSLHCWDGVPTIVPNHKLNGQLHYSMHLILTFSHGEQPLGVLVIRRGRISRSITGVWMCRSTTGEKKVMIRFFIHDHLIWWVFLANGSSRGKRQLRLCVTDTAGSRRVSLSVFYRFDLCCDTEKWVPSAKNLDVKN